MREEAFWETTVGAADVIVLAAVVSLALVNWAGFAGMAAAPAWKPWLSVAVALVLALASLTRRHEWTRAFRAATALWIIAAPIALGLPYSALVSAHAMIAGAVGATVAWPRLRRRQPATA